MKQISNNLLQITDELSKINYHELNKINYHELNKIDYPHYTLHMMDLHDFISTNCDRQISNIIQSLRNNIIFQNFYI